MIKVILALLALAIIPPIITEVYATHYSSVGIDDLWYWREWDSRLTTTEDVYCSFIDVDGGGARLEIEMNDDGTARGGRCMNIKTFDRADIVNDSIGNVFQLRYTSDCDGSCQDLAFYVLDGDYQQYYNSNQNGIFPDDANLSVDFSMYALDPGSWGNVENNSITLINSDCANTTPNGATATLQCNISVAEWDRTLTDKITVIWAIGTEFVDSSTNFYIQPLWFLISNTPQGTMQWDFPETASEVTMWNDFGIANLQLNGTNQDYGVYSTVNPDITDPPTNLFAVSSLGNIVLDWTAPVFIGYSPITGYKIERESPVGGGWTVLVTNTFDTLTAYTDTTADPANQEYNYRVRAINVFGESLPSNESKDGIPSSGETPIIDPTPDVDCTGELVDFELYVITIGTTTVTLCWNGEILPQHDLTGYQINYTTPWGIPLTEIISTGTNETTRLIGSLSPATDYSMRVQSINSLAFDISTLISNSTESVSAQSTDPDGLEVRTSGTNLWITDTLDDKVYQYNMTTTFDVDTLVYDDELNVVTNSDEPTGVCFGAAGAKMYVTSNVNDRLAEYDLSIAYNSTSGTHNQNLSVSSEGNQPEDCWFRGTGVQLWTLDGGTGDKVSEWSCSSTWNISTCTITTRTFSVSTQTTEPTGLDFNPTGTVMYIMDSTNDEIEEYDLSTAFDVTTAVHYQAKSITASDNDPHGLYLKTGGEKIYFTGSQNDSVYEWDFDLSIIPTSNQTNIVNFTTLTNLFDIGDLEFTSEENPDVFDWHWSRSELNVNDTTVLVNYPDSINATCVFDFKFARQNQTFSNLSTTPFETDRLQANFTLEDFNDDLITIHCNDENSNSTSMYLVYQDDFPLRQQIEDFRNGTFGTEGMFGVFDFITLAVVIFSLVGFNRINPAVAGVFSVMVLGVATYIGLVSSIFVDVTIGLLILVVTLAFVVHNRNDVAN